MNKKEGTIVVIQGPKFSTLAESKWFIKNDWDIINMTQYPENYFARELGLCYAAICSVTDYDAAIVSKIKMNIKNIERVLKIFKRNMEKTQSLVTEIIQNFKSHQSCECGSGYLGEFFKK